MSCLGLDHHKPSVLRGMAKSASDNFSDTKSTITESPDTGKLHVRYCAETSGNRGSYRKMFDKFNLSKVWQGDPMLFEPFLVRTCENDASNEEPKVLTNENIRDSSSTQLDTVHCC